MSAVLLCVAQPRTALGQVFAFGSNSFDQLGNTTAGNTLVPQNPAISGATMVSASLGHVLALKADGTVWAWGRNPYGQLGTTASSTLNPTPTQISGLTGVVAVAAGANHSLALMSDGTVWAWGRNQYGQLGSTTNSGTNNPNPTPAPVSGLTGVIAIAGLYNHCLALKSDGTIWAWGYNIYGQLGSATNNGTATPNPVPVQISGLTGFVGIATGSLHSLAVKADGSVWAWGWNGYGQLGFAANTNANPNPAQIGGLTNITAIASGAYHGLAVKNDGTIWTWGYNNDGELGYGSVTSFTATPVQASGLSGIIAVAGGDEHSMALKNDGTVWTWGFNYYGELGTATNFNTGNPNPTPAMVAGLSSIGGISAGSVNSFALIPAPVNVTIASADQNTSFTVTGSGCQPGTYSPGSTLSWTPGTSCQVTFPPSQLTATGTQDVFKNWADGPTGATRTFIVPPVNTTYTAIFSTQYLLTVLANPATAGTVTGGGYYDANSSAVVSASPGAGYVFSNWTGPVASSNSATTTITMTAPQTVTGNFVPSTITVTASVTAATKTYDQTATASITSCMLSGVAPADQGNVTCSAASASFSDANVGSGKNVTATGITLSLSGSATGKYGLSSTTATTTAGITAATVTASVVAANKVYDGTASATLTSCTPSGVIAGDSVTCAAASGTFASAGAGTWTVTATGISLGGQQAGNYSLNSGTATASATISRATPAISESGPSSSIYGQPATLTVTLTPPSGTVPTGQAYFSFTRNSTLYYLCPNGSISAASCGVSIGPNGSNYGATVTTSKLPAGTENIAVSYSGDTNFNGASTSTVLVNVVPADSAITLSKSTDPSAFGDAVAFTVKVRDNTANSVAVPSGTVVLSFKLSPADTATYSLCGDGSVSTGACAAGVTLSPDPGDAAGMTATATVTTTRLPVGRAASSFAYAINATYPGDGSFNASSPYVLGQTVNQRVVTVTATTDSKPYDGTAASTGVPVISGGSLLPGDTASFTQVFDSRNAGARTLTPSGIVNDGNGGSNYTYLFKTVNGTISKAALKITAVTSGRIFDGTINASAVPTYSGLQPGDLLTGLAETFDTPNAGTGKTLSVSAYVLNDSNSGGNYAVNVIPDITGVINPFPENGIVTLSAPEQSYTGAETITAMLPISSVGGQAAATSVSFYVCPAGAAAPTPSCQNMTPTAVPMTVAGNGLTGSATVNLTEAVSGALIPGAHAVLAVFAHSLNFSLNIPSAPLQIDKKVGVPTGDTLYTGATAYWAPSPSSNVTALFLAATVKDPCGAYAAGYAICGDVSKGTITFNVVDGTTLTPIAGATNLPIGLVNPGNTTVGTAAVTVPYHFNQAAAPLMIQVTVGSYFTGGNPSQSVTASIGSTIFINEMKLTGSLLCDSTASLVPSGLSNSYGTCSTNWAQPDAGLLLGEPMHLTQLDGDVITNNGGAQAKGTVTAQFVSMYKPDGTLDTTPHAYVVQTNSIATFSQSAPGVVNFTAGASIQDVTNPNAAVLVDSAALVQVTACASGVSCPGGPAVTGIAGAVGIQVNRSNTGGVWFSSGWNGKQTVPQNAIAGVVAIN